MKLSSFIQNKKKLFLGPKMPIWVFGSKYWKTIAIFLIKALQFILLQCFVQKLEFLNLEPTMPYLGVFGSNFEKTIVIFDVRAFEFALFQSLVQKIKILKFNTKNTRFVYFGARIWKYYCHIWNRHPSPVTSTKIGISSQNFLTFSVNPFGTLV